MAIRGETVFKIDLKYLENQDGSAGTWQATRWYDGAPQVFVGTLHNVLLDVAHSVQFAEPAAQVRGTP